MSASDSVKQRVLPPVKPPRIIIEHFDVSTYKVDQANGYVEAACRHCGATIKGQRNVTSNFIQHMRRRHAEEYGRFSAGAQPRQKRPKLFALPRATGLLVPPESATPFPTTEIVLETTIISSTFRASLRTKCQNMTTLSEHTGCVVFAKREDLQHGGSPAFRAAYNHISNTPIARAGILAAGRDALSVAIAAKLHGKQCSVLLKHSVSPALKRLMSAAEAKIQLVADNSLITARHLAAEQNRTLVDVAADLRTQRDHAVAGYGTLGLEILQQCAHAYAIFVRAGNAPLFAALAAILHRLGRGVKLVAVVLQGVRMNEDWRAFVNEVVQVSNAEMCGAVKSVFDDCDTVVDPEGALAVAGAIRFARDQSLSHERLLCVVDSPLRDFTQMRRVADLADRVDDDQCLFQLSRKHIGSFGDMMMDLSSITAAHISRVRFDGRWPALIGFICNKGKSKEQLGVELSTIGFDIIDVSGVDVDEINIVEWGIQGMFEGKAHVVFRVEIEESADGVRKLLAKQRGEVQFERVSYRYDGSKLARIFIATRAPEWQIVTLENELMGETISVRRMRRSDSSGMRVLGYMVSDDIGRRVSDMERAGNVVPDMQVDFDGEGGMVQGVGETANGLDEGGGVMEERQVDGHEARGSIGVQGPLADGGDQVEASQALVVTGTEMHIGGATGSVIQQENTVLVAATNAVAAEDIAVGEEAVEGAGGGVHRVAVVATASEEGVALGLVESAGALQPMDVAPEDNDANGVGSGRDVHAAMGV